MLLLPTERQLEPILERNAANVITPGEEPSRSSDDLLRLEIALENEAWTWTRQPLSSPHHAKLAGLLRADWIVFMDPM